MRLIRKGLLVYLVTLIFSTTAGGAGEHPTVFLILVDRLSMHDAALPEAAALRQMIAHGGVGLANVRAGAGGSAAGYLSLSAGGRASTGEHAGLAFSVDDTYRGQQVGLLYQALTGSSAGGGIVHLGIGELQLLATDDNRTTTPGLLGSALRSSGVPIAVYGNSDDFERVARYGVLVAMDDAGQVEAGVIGERSLTEDPDWPFGLRTDYTFLLEQAVRHMETGGLVVLELGDLARLEAMETLVSAEKLAQLRRQTIVRVAEFVRGLSERAQTAHRHAVALLLAPSPSNEALRHGYMLTPIMVLNFDSRQDPPASGALLTSSTTRRPGIVANADVGATILSLFGAPPQGAGRPIESTSHSEPWPTLQRLYHRITQVHSQRLPIIQPYFFVQLAAVLLTTSMAAGASRLGWRIQRLHPLLLVLHLSLVAFPVALLILPVMPVAPTVSVAWLLVSVTMLSLALLARPVRKWGEVAPFTLLCAITSGVILWDLLTGTRLLQSSHLGYDPIGGSRYYGIGNEYMGVLLGTATVAGGGLLDLSPPDRRARIMWAIGLVYALIVFLLASPAHGANVGGTISAVVGLGVVLILLSRDRLHIWHLVVLGALVAVVVGAAAWYDVVHFGADTSHLGNTVQQVGTNGTDPLWNLFERKLEMNARLIRLTVWSRAFFVSLLAALLFAFLRPRTVEGLLHAHPYMARAIRGSLAGAVVVLLVNDSGIVGAATLMIPVISTLLYLVLTLVDKPTHQV